jgi:Ca2+-binding RTX toxin-like protein
MQGGAGADWLYVTGTQFNDGIMVYDPDENEGVISSNLTVQVWSPATPGSGLGFGAIMQSMTISAVESTDRLIVIAQDGNDRIELRNPSTANTRVGLPAMLVGGSGNDTIFDGLGADLLFGDSAYTILPTDGVDQLNTVDGQNHDTLVGTNGIDTFTRDATDTITFTT